MWRILIYAVLFGILYWIVRQALFPKKGQVKKIEREGEELIQDPVCKCYIPKSQAYAVPFQGKKIYFCTKECYKKFLSGRALPKP